MAFAAQLASDRLGGAQVAAVRFAVMLLPILLVPALLRRTLTMHRFDLLIYRGVFGGVAVLLYFLAIEHTSAGVATLLNYSSPIWSVLFATWLLDEPARGHLVLPLGGALLGVTLVLLDPARIAAGEAGSAGQWGIWGLAGLASAVLSGAAVTAIRAARRTESSWAIYGSFSLFGLVACAPFAWASWLWPTPREWLYLVLVGLSSVSAQLLMTHAYRWATNLEAGVIAQIAVVIAMALGVLVRGESMGPWTVAGACLAIGSVVAVIWIQRPPRVVE